MKILALIPARRGPDGLPGKSLRTVGGLTLLARAVRVARAFLKESGADGTIFVDTDSEDVAREGRRWGAEVPFLRSTAPASDETPMIDGVLAALDRLSADRGPYDVVVLLEPTAPLRQASDVLECFRAYDPGVGAVASVAKADRAPEQTTRAIYVSSVASLRAHRAFVVPGTRSVVLPASRAVRVDSEEDLAVADFLASRAKVRAVRIGSRSIEDGAPAFVIAEAGVNHNGDVRTAHELVDVAANSGADAVKFQTFDPARLVSRRARMAPYQIENTGSTRTQAEMLSELVLPRSAHRELADHAASRGILFLSSPFDESSADFLDELAVPAFKLGSGELTNHPFLAHVARKGKPLLISTGMADLVEVAAALDAIEATGNSGVVLLHCVTSYPAAPADSNLLAMRTLRSAFGVPVGYSDHTEGIEIAVAACALGAAVIEKHFTLDRRMPGPDHRASLDPTELSALVFSIRAVESARGDGTKIPRPVELPLIVAARKSLHAARALEPGHVLLPGDLVALRPGDGISPARLAEVVGRKLIRPIAEGDPLEEDHVD